MEDVTLIKYEEFFIGWVFKINTNTVKNLTGYTPLVQIRPTKSSDTVLASYTSDSLYMTFEPLNGLVSIELPPSVTGGFNFKNAVIDCLVYTATDGDRSPTTRITVDSGVSRPT